MGNNKCSNEMNKIVGCKMKFNYMKIKDNVFTWKQIEKKEDRVFMRIKTRPFITIKYLEKGWAQ